MRFSTGFLNDCVKCNPVTREEMKINALATNGKTLEVLSPQSVVVEWVIFVVFALFASLILIDAALELVFH